MKHSYEMVVVFDGSLSDDVLHKEQASVEAFLGKNATFEKTIVWGKLEMAYPIRRKRTGCYCLFYFQASGDIISRLEADFGLNQNVLRFLTVQQTSVAAPAAAATPAAAVAPAARAAHEEASHA